MRVVMEKTEKGWKTNTIIMFVCWLVYSCSYLGKVNYAANIPQIEAFFKVSHADAGLVSTFFFFAYAAGQIFNGIFCKRYNLKWMIFGAVIVSATVNALIALIKSFALIKFLWLVNGLALSVLWPSLIRFLSEVLPKKQMAQASMVMGTTVATGTLIIYGLSALFAAVGWSFKLAFFTPAVVMPITAIIWLFGFDRLVKNRETDEEEVAVESVKQPVKGAKMPKDIFVMCCILAFTAVATNLIKDGLTTWVPSILKESYGLSASFSILLTLALPALSVFGNVFAVWLHKRISNFIIMEGIIFLGAGIFTAVVIAFLGTGAVAVTLIGFVLVKYLASSSNSVITSIFPLFMKGKVNSGFIAGILNGFCYLGSTISSYGLGLIADLWSWNAVFYVLLGACIAVVGIALVYGLVKKK